jgi:hypothetical protein
VLLPLLLLFSFKKTARRKAALLAQPGNSAGHSSGGSSSGVNEGPCSRGSVGQAMQVSVAEVGAWYHCKGTASF